MSTTHITKYPMCVIFCSQSSSEYHLFGITESRLDFRITDHGISTQNYHIIRRDPQLPGQTGNAVYVHQSVQAMTETQRLPLSGTTLLYRC